MKITTIRKKLAKLDHARVQLEKQSRDILLSLPQIAGLSTVAELIEALTPLVDSRRPARKGRPAKGQKRGKRAKITDEMKDQVKKLAGEGKTGAEIAKAVGISLPSVQNIKKAAGLVKARKG